MKLVLRLLSVFLVLFSFVFSTNMVLPALAAKSKTAEKKSESYIAATDGTLYHKAFCPMVSKIKPKDRLTYKSSDAAEAAGYYACGMCVSD